jgi:hypothetical protein
MVSRRTLSGNGSIEPGGEREPRRGRGSGPWALRRTGGVVEGGAPRNRHRLVQPSTPEFRRSMSGRSFFGPSNQIQSVVKARGWIR